MSNKSLLDVAYEIISQEGNSISFNALWVKVCEVEGMDENDKVGKIGKFYTSLVTDGRFVNLGDNTWDLRSKYTFDKVHIDMSDCYSDEEEEEDKDPEELLSDGDEDEIFKEDDENDDESEYEPDTDSHEDL